MSEALRVGDVVVSVNMEAALLSALPGVTPPIGVVTALTPPDELRPRVRVVWLLQQNNVLNLYDASELRVVGYLDCSHNALTTPAEDITRKQDGT